MGDTSGSQEPINPRIESPIHALLHARHLLRGNIQAQVSTREDDGVGLRRDAVELQQRRAVLNLRIKAFPLLIKARRL